MSDIGSCVLHYSPMCYDYLKDQMWDSRGHMAESGVDITKCPEIRRLVDQ